LELSSSSSAEKDPNNDTITGGGTEKSNKHDEMRWRANVPRNVYASPLLWETRSEWKAFMKQFQDDVHEHEHEHKHDTTTNQKDGDHLWEQVKLEALSQLGNEPEAGPQLYQSILSQGSLVEAIVSIIAHEVESELIKATEIKKVFLDMLTEEDEESIHCDVIAAATRSPSVELAVLAILFHTGLHALVCYRVGHRLWKVNRTGLAKYLQSTISRHYSADIHPACQMGQGVYLCTASGVVIGETATVGDDVSILHGVTLGGTGKELGDRHPKVQHGVILKDCSTVLGNIAVGTGAVVMAKAIVNKPVPPLAIMSGVPARMIATRVLEVEAFDDDLEEHLAFKYLDEWKEAREKQEKLDDTCTTRSK